MRDEEPDGWAGRWRTFLPNAPRLMRGAAIGLFLVALWAPAFEFANGFGSESTEVGWEALIMAVVGVPLGFSAGLLGWLSAVAATLLNVLFLSSLVVDLWWRDWRPPRPFVTYVGGGALVVMSVFVWLLGSRDRPSFWSGPTRMHFGAFLWLTAMWLNRIGRVWRPDPR